jgi:hypothetical protein
VVPVAGSLPSNTPTRGKNIWSIIMPEGGPTIQTPVSSGYLPCALTFFLIIPVLFTKPGLNNAGYIPNGLPVYWFRRVVHLKNKSSTRRMGKKSLRFNFLFENLYILLNIRLIV